jgi:peptidyl-prolyl cis-trans isomerase B (cyclophilin B)
MATAQQPSTASIETDFGTIELELWPDAAPLHVANFRKLARAGFYRGTGFHRIVPGFVIQGGCPEGDGTGGPGWTVPAEFNARRHVKGVLSMARSAHPDSAGSQFFICLGDAPHLDGQYSAFGRVTAGMDVVEQIAAVECDAHGRPAGRLPEMRIVTA